jgi:asparagine synthetase B (glutamine-hydrolysing)
MEYIALISMSHLRSKEA